MRRMVSPGRPGVRIRTGDRDNKPARFFGVIALLFGLMASQPAAARLPAFQLVVVNGRFTPEVIQVPAHTRFKIIITNAGQGPEEFESRDLRKETVLAPGVSRTVVFAPLKPGTYHFFGEFHPDTAQGRIVAK